MAEQVVLQARIQRKAREERSASEILLRPLEVAELREMRVRARASRSSEGSKKARVEVVRCGEIVMMVVLQWSGKEDETRRKSALVDLSLAVRLTKTIKRGGKKR